MSSRAWSDGEQVLAAGLDPAHRTTEQPRRRGGGQLLAIERDLLTEAAADVRGDHPDRALGNAEPRGQRRAHRMRDLGRVPERERLVAGLPARQAAARLERHVRLAALVEAHRDDPVCRAEGRRDVAVGEYALIGTVRRNRLVDQRQPGILGALGIDHGRKRRVLHVDEGAGVLDLIALLADHAGHEIADEADLVHRQGRHLHGQEPLDRRRDPERRRHAREVVAGQHGDDARLTARGVGVDPKNARVGVRAADEGGVQHARRREVADVAAAPEDQLLRLARAQRRADVGHGAS